jgi:hypothetical protein
MKKYTLEELKSLGKKVYPASLKEVKRNKYKVPGFDGYLLLDDINKDGTVTQLFYRSKWRSDNINIIKGNILYTLLSNIDKRPYGRFGTIEEAKKQSDEFVSENNKYCKEFTIIANYETLEVINDAEAIGEAPTNFSKITITKDNIHLYYEFMSDDDFNKYGAYLRILFTSRYTLIRKHFQKIGLLVDNGNGYDFDMLHYKGDVFEYDCPFGDTSIKSKSYKGISFFGVKDTLKPIDEYIEEIKTSSEYKEYIESKGV